MATNKRKPEVNFAEELAVAFRGGIYVDGDYLRGPNDDALESLMDLIVEPDANLTPGQMVRLGAVFSHLGKVLTDAGKATAEKFTLEESAGVYFSYRQPTTQVRGEYQVPYRQVPIVQLPGNVPDHNSQEQCFR